MTDDSNHRFAIRRKLPEALAWVLAISLLWGIDLLTKIAERDRAGFGKDDFRLITEQLTSGMAALAMIPFVIYWLRLFPLQRGRVLPAIIGHAAGTAIFAFGHYSLLVALRYILWSFYNLPYQWMESFAANLLLEYQKDIKIYLGIVLIISGYQYYFRTRANSQRPDNEAGAGNRLIVQTGSGESVLRHQDIHYLEASRNYVAVHTENREYLVRDTISNLVMALPIGQFARCHRSFIVNIDAIAEIKSIDGSYRITLHNKKSIPLSRRYRDALKSALTG